VSKALLYTLVVLSFLFVGFGAVLALVALAATYNTDLEEVRQRLSVQQLVAEKFEGHKAHVAVYSLDDCFGEFKGPVLGRVGVVRSAAGGWELKGMGDTVNSIATK
jgi:hypothetical protein